MMHACNRFWNVAELAPSKDRQLNGTSPLLGIQNPLPVLLIGFAQEAVVVCERVICHCICYYPPVGLRMLIRTTIIKTYYDQDLESLTARPQALHAPMESSDAKYNG